MTQNVQSIAKVFVDFNTFYVSCVYQLQNMFKDDIHLKETKDALCNVNLQSQNLVLEIQPTLEPFYNAIHREDATFFENKDVVLCQRLSLSAIYLRMDEEEKPQLWERLKTLAHKCALCRCIGKQAPIIDDIFQTFAEKNPQLQGKDKVAVQRELGLQLFLDEELREKVFGLFESGTDTLSSMVPLMRSMGLTKDDPDENKEEKDKDNNDTNSEENGENKGLDELETFLKDNMKETPDSDAQQKMSYQYLSRKKKLAAQRKLKKAGKVPVSKPSLPNQLCKMMEDMQKDSSFDPKEFRTYIDKMFQDEKTRDMYQSCMERVKGPNDIPHLVQSMLQEYGQTLNPDEKKMMERMKGMNHQQMLAFCQKEMKKMNKK